MTSRPRRSRARARADRGAAKHAVERPSVAERYALPIVFASAAAIRFAVALSLADLPLVRTPKLDAAEYVSWARAMADGNFAWPAVSAHGPGYPLFLAAIFALGGSTWSAIVIQCALGALTAACIASLTTRWFDWRAGLCAGLLYATFGPAVFVETSLLAEGLLLALLMLSLALVSSARDSLARPALAGLLIGAAVLVRPTALIVAAAVVAALVLNRERRRVASAAVFLACACLLVAPALAKNWRDSRTFGIQGFGGLNFYIGNSPLHNGRPMFRLGAGWDALNAEPRLAGITDPAAQDRYYIHKALAEIGSHPSAYARLVGEKILWLVQSAEVRDSHSFYFFTGQSWTLAMLPRMAILVPLAFIGALVATTNRRWPPLLVAYTIGAAATVAVLVVGTRYRLPVVPAYAMLAGVGASALMEAVLKHDRRELAIMATTALAAVLASHLLGDPASHDVSEEWAMTGGALVTEHDLAAAESAYREALAINPDSGIGWDGLGLTLYDARRFSEARVALDRAAVLDPVNARTAYYRGLVDEAERHPDAAVTHLRRAITIDPTNLDAARHLASDLIATRRDRDAVPVLESIVKHAPDDAEIHRTLAGALGGSGRLPEARTELETAVRLDASNGEAWLDLCLVSLDLNRGSDAVSACARARQLGASKDRLGMAERALEARSLTRGK